MEFLFVKYLFATLFIVQIASSSNILFFWGLCGYSHRIATWPVIEALASRGHNITYFSGHKSKSPTTHAHPNITDITPPNLIGQIGMDYDRAKLRLEGGVQAAENLWLEYQESGIKLCEVITSDKSIFNLLNSSSFDLVVINGLFNECGFPFAWKYKAPTIVFGTSGYFSWYTETYGFPDENYPEYRFHLPTEMSFFQEVWNAMQPFYWKLYRNYYYFPKLERIVKKAFKDENMPSIQELERNASLILANTHFSEEFPRSLPPWVVHVGGMHIATEVKPLQPAIENFIKKWKDGFIYFSLGTYLKLPLLPQSHKDAIFGAIQKFSNIGFILKWNGGEVPKDLPANALTAEWMDQQTILAHPKVRAFIAHGGLLGMQEAAYHGVPMIVFPVFGDQDFNAMRTHSANRGIMLEISELKQEKLENAIHEIITNKRYKENMMKVSKQFLDRPQKPVETAVFWVEYVLRHKDTSFLKPFALNKTWYEKRMLHVWGFVFATVSIVLAVIYFILKKIIVKLVCKDKINKIKTS